MHVNIVFENVFLIKIVEQIHKDKLLQCKSGINHLVYLHVHVYIIYKYMYLYITKDYRITSLKGTLILLRLTDK